MSYDLRADQGTRSRTLLRIIIYLFIFALELQCFVLPCFQTKQGHNVSLGPGV